jgi:hypothetical protein
VQATKSYLGRCRPAAALAALALTWASAPGLGASGPTYKHLGPESCGSSVCHSKIAPQANGVALNEYRVWLLQDRHSQAYKGLLSPLGKSIAQRLGVKTDDNFCLNCHADNVPASSRGPQFRIGEGVGCEACHGGAERWIQSHARRTATHSTNLQAGMNPTETPALRAQICLGCHLGTQDRFATHDLMAAGHPRLRFELDTFTANQPAHFKMKDPDYIRRKGATTDAGLWISGELEAARRYLILLQSGFLTPGHLAPEFALYACYACHQSIASVQNSKAPTKTVSSGHLRLQLQYLDMLGIIARVTDSNESAVQLANLIDSLNRAGQTDVAATRAAAGQLLQWIGAHDSWTRQSLAVPQTVALRRALVRFATSGNARDFLVAEQVVLGMESLSYGANDHDQHQGALDALYGAAKSSASFDGAKFVEVAAKVQSQF